MQDLQKDRFRIPFSGTGFFVSAEQFCLRYKASGTLHRGVKKKNKKNAKKKKKVLTKKQRDDIVILTCSKQARYLTAEGRKEEDKGLATS